MFLFIRSANSFEKAASFATGLPAYDPQVPKTAHLSAFPLRFLQSINPSFLYKWIWLYLVPFRQGQGSLVKLTRQVLNGPKKECFHCYWGTMSCKLSGLSARMAGLLLPFLLPSKNGPASFRIWSRRRALRWPKPTGFRIGNSPIFLLFMTNSLSRLPRKAHGGTTSETKRW